MKYKFKVGDLVEIKDEHGDVRGVVTSIRLVECDLYPPDIVYTIDGVREMLEHQLTKVSESNEVSV